MNYFRSYSLSSDAGIVAAWDSQIARAADAPWLEKILTEHGAELFAEFAKRYAEIRALPRSARRALQQKLAASGELATIPSDWRRRVAYSVAGAALLLALGQGAQAGTINVTAKTPPGIIPGDNRCSLIEAIIAAETEDTYDACTGATFSPNTIVLPPKSKLVLTTPFPSGLADYDTGLPVITTRITISGNGSTISRSKNAAPFRLFTVANTGDLTLNNVTLSSGYAPLTRGGAIYNKGVLEINNSIISGNLADAGAIFSVGSATITETTFSKNSARSYGGGIVNDESGIMDLQNSTVTGNRANLRGGGIANYYGEMNVTNSTVSKNTASYGGGLSNYDGTVVIDPSLITGNKALAGGGIASIFGSVYIDRSTVSKNTAGVFGGGILNIGAYVKVYNFSLITGNKGGLAGGGVFNCGTFDFTYSTITKNSALYGGGVVNTSGEYGENGEYSCTDYFSFNSGYIYGNKAKVGPNFYP